MNLSDRTKIILYLIDTQTLRHKGKVIRHFKTAGSAFFYRRFGNSCSTYVTINRDAKIFKDLIEKGLIERSADGRRSLFLITGEGSKVLKTFKAEFK